MVAARKERWDEDEGRRGKESREPGDSSRRRSSFLLICSFSSHFSGCSIEEQKEMNHHREVGRKGEREDSVIGKKRRKGSHDVRNLVVVFLFCYDMYFFAAALPSLILHLLFCLPQFFDAYSISHEDMPESPLSE